MLTKLIPDTVTNLAVAESEREELRSQGRPSPVVQAAISPKLAARRASAYKYYAGFSEDFVAETVLKYASPGMRVLDPWNGSGTTTGLCSINGIASVGLDINPAMLPVAWSRIASAAARKSYCQRFSGMSVDALFSRKCADSRGSLISDYFTAAAVSRLSSIRECAISLIYEFSDEKCLNETDAAALSGVAFIIVTEVIRAALKPIRGTNPSWFSKPKSTGSRIHLDKVGAQQILKEVLSNMSEARLERAIVGGAALPPTILTRDSREDLADLGLFDLVVTSPPYCTRIDYGVATLPELLALGGMTAEDFVSLRKRITGSLVTEPGTATLLASPNQLVLRDTLGAISNHDSKAAKTYYLRYFTSYFNDLVKSLGAVGRVVKDGGDMILVVQNSFFKEIEIDLAKISIECLEASGFVLISRNTFPVNTPISISNPRYKKYRQRNIHHEEVLVLKKVNGESPK